MLCRFLFADFLKLYQISKTADIFQDLKPTIEALMKQIFPKQYGLDNVFSSLQNVSDSFSYASLLDGTFSSSGPKPNKKAAGNWRLRAMKALVEEMLVKVQKCQFKALLQYYCPVESIDHGTGSAQPDITSLLANFSTFDQSAFYVTDSSYQRNKVFYYRHGLWRNITRSAMNSIQGNMFIKMEPDEVSRCNKVYSKVRFLPKTYDLRPIINLRRKAPRLVNGQLASDYKSINNRLKNAFLILAYERSRQKAISSAMGMSDLFHRLKQIKAKLVDTSSTRQQRLYMVKVDIKKSFDSINQENLLKIIDHMLKEDKYIIYRHSKVMPANGRMMKRFYPKAIAPSEMPSFLDFAREQAEISKHAVLVDKALVRLADDFLFISQCKNKATEFLETMSRGHPEYGCYINEHKTVTNFKALLTGGQCVQQCHENDFPYCGLLLNSRTLEIRADYSRYSGEDIRNLLTVSRDSQPSRSIIFKMKKAMQHTCQMAFSDTTHNSYSKVLLNIFQNFLFCAMKFHAYLLELFLDPTLSSSSSSSSSSQGQSYIIQPTDLIGILDSIFKAAYGLLHNGRRSVVGITAGIKFEVHERHVQWLGAQAFLRILPGGDNDKNDSVTCSSSSSLSSSSTAFISSSSLSSSSSSSSSYCEDRQNRMPRHVYTPLKRYLRTEIVERLEIEELKPHFRRMLYSTISDPRNVIFDQIRYK
ncbi:hypothetical protein FBU30_007324 [Linnemannia zychae]|nr:hypothetical protein FBU30_007324 [Linnemannia zychae]